MDMKVIHSITLLYFYFSLVSLTACGGGGGGGGSNLSSPPPVSYTGSTAPADLTSSNSKDITGDATTMGTGSSTTSNVASVNSGQQTINTGTSIYVRATTKAVINKINSGNSPALNIGAITSASNNIPGSCGGSQSISMDYDDVALTLTGTFTFNNYCEDGITLNGQGTLNGSLSGNDISLTLNLSSLLISDRSSGLVYKQENYVSVSNFNISSGNFSLTTTGRFYHPTYGYVQVTTPVTMQFTGTSPWPYSGSIKVTEEGTAPVDSATLTALNSTEYQLDIDLGNDGTIESSTLGKWSDL